MPTVTVTIDAEGNVQVGVRGAPGPACKDLTRELEAALGETIKDSSTREMRDIVHLPLRRSVRR